MFLPLLQWAGNQKCIYFAISSNFKTSYFVLKDKIRKKNPNITLSTFPSPCPQADTNRGDFVALIACVQCGCRGCTAAQASGSDAGMHSWSWTRALSEWFRDGEFSQEFGGARLEWFHGEQMLMSKLESVQTVHHTELAGRITAEHTFMSMQSLTDNWQFRPLKSLNFTTEGAAGVTKFGKGSWLMHRERAQYPRVSINIIFMCWYVDTVVV